MFSTLTSNPFQPSFPAMIHFGKIACAACAAAAAAQAAPRLGEADS